MDAILGANLFEIETERVSFIGRHAGADRLDRAQHAALAAEQSVGEARRIAHAICISSRVGLSAQAAVKAAAVERLMPA